MIDQLIEVTTLAAISWVVCEFVSYSWQRVSKERKAAQQFYQSVAEVTGETKPICVACGEPTEWSDTYCQDHWEDRCAEAFWAIVPELREEQPDVSPEVQEVESRFTDGVVPFRRPERQLSDAELIAWAKQNKFPGAGKWAKNRKLSAKVRAELLQLARQTA